MEKNMTEISKREFVDYSLEKGAESEQAMSYRIMQVKEIIDQENISPNIKELLQNIEVMAVITKIKPASFISRSTEKSTKNTGSKFTESTLTENEIFQLETVLHKLGLEMFRHDYKIENSTRDLSENFTIYNIDECLIKMKKCNLFTEREIETAFKDFKIFFDKEYSNKSDYGRIGILYGYPKCDVEDFIRMRKIEKKYRIKNFDLEIMIRVIRGEAFLNEQKKIKLQNVKSKEEYRNLYNIEEDDYQFLLKKSITIKNIDIEGAHTKDKIKANNRIIWKSYNFGSKEVEALIKHYALLKKLQKEIFKYDE